MNFQERRGPRGAGRATPEDILREAIALHRAIKERDLEVTKLRERHEYEKEAAEEGVLDRVGH